MKANSRNSIILSSLGEAEKAVKAVSEVPAGYIEVKLSTRGKVGAPEVIHVRNFKVSDIIGLSMSTQMELPIRLTEILDDMILEPVSTSSWHEKEIEELMVYIFLSFYRDTIDDVVFPWDDSDIEYLKGTENGEQKIKDLQSGKWVPRTSINIAKNVDTYDIPDDYNPRMTIVSKKTGFRVTFDYIKYGDQIVIKNWLDSYFANEEARFSRIKKEIDINNNLSRQFLDDPSKLDKYINIDENEENEYRNYLIRRTQTITDVAHIVSIINIDGEDISGLSIGEKYEKLSDDARIDYNLIKHLSQRQAKVPIGIKPEVTMIDPITNEVVKRPFSFRIPVILQALQLSGHDGDDDGFDDEA